MIFKELLKKPAALISENNIVKDIVIDNDNASIILDRLGEKKEDFSEFFMVYLDEDGRVKAVMAEKDVSSLLIIVEKLLKNKKLDTEKIKDMKLTESFPLDKRIFVKRSDELLKVLEVFRNKDISTDVVIIVDESDAYAGKIRRKSLLKKIDSLLNQNK